MLSLHYDGDFIPNGNLSRKGITLHFMLMLFHVSILNLLAKKYNITSLITSTTEYIVDHHSELLIPFLSLEVEN